MIFEELCDDVRTMLYTLRLDSKEHCPSMKVEYQFIIDQFGIIVHVVNSKFYELPELDPYEDWRQIHISEKDDLNKKREEMVWEIMKSGYMTWLRETHQQAFKNLILNYDYSKKIIDQRLKIWNGKPKYKFLIERNVRAYSMSSAYIMSAEPAFFDDMPEGEVEDA
ncbi:MAG: hypothetical protein DRO67_08160 [Candidatus Asgardarchaeum californiense]|nr:MAG: hypothetical protein DRO67_08160 [Candidatus Asgardarchaeum californiense]